MKKSPLRIAVFALIVIGLALLFNQYFIHFSGDGKRTPEEALPTDQQYEWIEGPKTENEHRYFFLSNEDYFGTGTVTKNFSGWSSEDGVFAKLPTPLSDNVIKQAYSDQQIIYGLFKPNGEVTVTVNGIKSEFIDLNQLPEDVLYLYKVNNYSIWYVDLSNLENTEEFIIQIVDSNNEVIHELII